MRYSSLFFGAVVSLSLTLAAAFADTTKPDLQPAKAAAQKWLSLVDSGRYPESWQQSASVFREHITSDQWSGSLQKILSVFGKFKHRKLKSEQYLTSVPGGPPGKYVVLQYDASFQNKPDAVETVTPMLDKDGAWRVSGYYIK